MLFGAAIAAATFYLALLFGLAAREDQRANAGHEYPRRAQSWIYGLSLAVYCTSWTFFGGVGTAATAGWHYLPIYLGPILVFTLGYGLVRRVLGQAKAQHSTSIADFLSARYGKSAWVAALVTIIATIGSLPYMALQLQSVGNSLLVLTPELANDVALDEIVLMTAGLMALFAVLFGSRRVDSAGDNAGLVATIAVESIVKLVALIAVAGLALFALAAGEVSLQGNKYAFANVFRADQIDARFAVLTLIAACAAFCLPRQFHLAFVEARTDRPDNAMRWVFPAYLVLVSLVIVPIVLAGLTILPEGTDPDSIVLALPLIEGSEALALLVFLGGFSAAAGMIVVASVALSMMITNDLVAPLVFRRELRGHADRARLGLRLLAVRRLVIGALLFFAYLVYLGLGSISSLAGLGILAFAAMAQFAPGLIFGMISRQGNRMGMLAGLSAGFLLWAALLIVPAFTGQDPVVMVHPDSLVSGVLLSLGANVALYWLGSTLGRGTLVDDAQAAAFVGSPTPGTVPATVTRMRVADIRLLLVQFVGERRASEAIASLPDKYHDTDAADEAVIGHAERTIAGVVGTSSARMLVASWSQGEPVPMAEVMAMFDETNRRLSFNGELLQIAIEHIETGVALVDAEMNLVAWNSQYEDLFGLPEDLVAVGRPIADMIRFNLSQSGLDERDIEQQVKRRLEHMKAGREHRMEREQHDGRIMRIIGNPAPGGGYVTSYTDITADRRAEQALEEKVAERTQQLSAANAALEQATRSKTRFLAAASHDLIQPLNAARLFASALGEEVRDHDQLMRLVGDLDGSIASADRLIRALLDISKLDGGGIEPRLELFAVNDLLEDIVREFAVQAEAQGLELKHVSSTAWVHSDRTLLASVLRNLVSNAVRYTDKGTVLLGVRRKGKDILLTVHDTGPGIPDADRDRIFEEFQRASGHREGLGLGLAIVRRTANLLDAPISLQSVYGRGSTFSVQLPVVRWGAIERASIHRAKTSVLHAGRVLVVDNDPAALSATSALLTKWKLEVVSAAGEEEALRSCPVPPDLVIMDYRLDRGERGDGVYASLCRSWNTQPPSILLTAESGEETDAAAKRMGAHRLLKPSSPAALRALIAGAVAQKAQDEDQLDDPTSAAG